MDFDAFGALRDLMSVVKDLDERLGGRPGPAGGAVVKARAAVTAFTAALSTLPKEGPVDRAVAQQVARAHASAILDVTFGGEIVITHGDVSPRDDAPTRDAFERLVTMMDGSVSWALYWASRGGDALLDADDAPEADVMATLAHVLPLDLVETLFFRRGALRYALVCSLRDSKDEQADAVAPALVPVCKAASDVLDKVFLVRRTLGRKPDLDEPNALVDADMYSSAHVLALAYLFEMRFWARELDAAGRAVDLYCELVEDPKAPLHQAGWQLGRAHEIRARMATLAAGGEIKVE